VIPAPRVGKWRSLLVAPILVCCLLPGRAAIAQGRAQNAISSTGAPAGPGWSFHVETQGDFESNPNFQAAPNDASDISGSAGGGFGYGRVGSRGTFSLSGEGRGLFYRELTSLNTVTFGGSMAARYRPGPKTDLMFNGTVTNDYTRHSDILLSQGIVLPQSRVLTMRFDAALSHSLSTRTSLSVSGRFERAEFDSPGLSDGTTLDGTVSLSHRLNQTVSLRVGYSHDQIDSDIQKRSVDTGYGGARIVVNPRTDVDVNVGASSTGGGTGGRKITPYGGAALTVKHPRLVMTLAYNHQVREDYGFGQVSEADLASFNLNRVFGRRKASYYASLTYALNRAPNASSPGEDFSSETYGATVGLQVPMGRRIRVDGGYAYFRTSQPQIDSHTAFVALSYRVEPH
jgi:Putative beta-barrel porin 2